MTPNARRWVRPVVVSLALFLIIRFGFHQSWAWSALAPILLLAGAGVTFAMYPPRVANEADIAEAEGTGVKAEVEAIGYVEGLRPHPEDDHWGGEEACITLTERFGPDALQGLSDFSHAEVLFLFHQVDPAQVVYGARHPRSNPNWPEVGIFAQRPKMRPNRIGSTICRIVRVDGVKLYVAELDAIDGTPVLDIKPVMAEFLPREDVRQPAWSHELMAHYWEVRT
jgi:tRNA (Thr-GGU) A37 N-methylase